MHRYKFLIDGWNDEEAFFVNAFSLYEAVSVFEDSAKHNFWDYKKIIVEIID